MAKGHAMKEDYGNISFLRVRYPNKHHPILDLRFELTEFYFYFPILTNNLHHSNILPTLPSI